jgi:hypothetical protein
MISLSETIALPLYSDECGIRHESDNEFATRKIAFSPLAKFRNSLVREDGARGTNRMNAQ